MSLEDFEKAIDSLEGFPGNVGIMGGEPTLHPQFLEILAMFRQKWPWKNRREFWTSGYKWEEYKDAIFDTFDEELIAYNNHLSPDVKHTPLLVAIRDIVKNKKDRQRIIEECWCQRRWSASINPRGAYFCEIAAALDLSFDGPGGWPIEKGWWKRDPKDKDFQEQVRRLCDWCGATLPIGETSDKATYDVVSKSNLKRLKKLGSPKILQGKYSLYERQWTFDEVINKKTNYAPQNYRTFKAHKPEDYQGKDMVKSNPTQV